MRKLIFPFSAVLILLSLAAFKIKDLPAIQFGTYGVCLCDQSESSNQSFAVTLNADNTFHYLDNSNPENKIELKGNWVLENHTIVLKDYKSDSAIRDKWLVDKNGKCIRSRIGLSYFQLCNLNACN